MAATFTKGGRSWCRVLVGLFVLLYVAAAALYVIGTFGLFGSPSGPLAGIFLVPLGLPWIAFTDRLGLSEAAGPWIGLLAPLINLAIIAGVCRLLRRN